MDTTPLCPGCGKPLAPSAPKGLCQACLLKAALPTGTDSGGAAHPFDPPSVAELAAKFPQLEVLELIGTGGMGAVYRARQKELDRVVALKILPPGVGQDPAFADRFTREAKALARLNHPGVVTLYEFGRANGLFYFLMEFVDGVSLRRVLEAGRMAPREALAIIPQICDALQYAHDQGIVHRDIKPENILLDRRGRVKVADFGLAKLVSSGSDFGPVEGAAPAPTALTEAGKIMGTPCYMAPEQAAHPREVDHRADIYALGVVLYQMLTGELPGKPIKRPSTMVSIDVRLDEVVLRALEQRPERRYQQVSVLKTQVETIAAGAPFAPTAPASSLVGLFENLMGMRFTSSAAIKALKASPVGFLAFACALALIGVTRTPWVGWCLAAVGLLALAGPVVLAWLLETRAQRVAASHPPPDDQLVEGDMAKKQDTRDSEPGFGRTPVARPIVPHWVTAVRWTARVLGTLAILLILPFILVEGLPPIATQPGGVQLTFVGGFLLLLGFIVGWWRDGVAALLIAAGWTVIRISESGLPSLFELVLVPAALYALCWWATRDGRLVPLLASAAGLAVVLALGRIFCPVNVFVSGVVSDSATGKPLANAELRWLPRPVLAPGETDRPNMRADKDGRFRLYVGWYSEGQQLAIYAPSYAILATNLGPRPLGARRLNRDFQLQPEGEFGAAVERVLYSVTSQRPIKGEDLDLGREITLPPDLAQRGEQQFFHWLASEGVDLMAWAHTRFWTLWASPKFASVENSQWDRPVTAQLRGALQSGDTGSLRQETDSMEGFGSYTLQTNAALPLTFAFETRRGNQGLLQVTGFTDSPRGLKTRYKLLRSPQPVVQPGTGTESPVLLEGRGLSVTALTNGLWQASVTFRNQGRSASPAFPVLFYAGPPNLDGRLVSRNTAGPIGPGELFCELTGPFVLRPSETDIFAVIDPENTLQRPAASTNWLVQAPAMEPLTLRQALQEAFARLKGLKLMVNDRFYRLVAGGRTLMGGPDDFLRRRTGQEILASGLSCGCGDNALAFISLMERRGWEALWVEGVEISLISLKNRFSGHVVVAVHDPGTSRWLLVDPTDRSVLSEDWSRADKTFSSNYWIGFVGPLTNYPVRSPGDLREFYDRTLKTIPAEALNRHFCRLKFTVDGSLLGADGAYLNPRLAEFLATHANVFDQFGIHPEEEVRILLVRGSDDALSTLTYSDEKGWVCTLGLRSACSLSFLSYLEKEVARRRLEGK